jgi:TRAP-type C4-dicarboxylate transport system permease large subunit
MIFSLLLALAFSLLTAGYILRDYPWKNESQTRVRAFYSVFALAILALLGGIAVALSGMEGEKNPFASGLVAVSAIAVGTVIILSMTVWPRKKKDMVADDQRAV